MTTHDTEELWISRAIDRCASAEDWRRLDALAAADGDVWRRLAHTLRAESLLVRGLQGVVGGDAHPPAADVADVTGGRRRTVVAAAGALLVLAAAFASGRRSVGALPQPAAVPAHGEAPDGAGAGPVDATERLLAGYLEAGRASGRVLDELPLQALSTQRRADGDGLDVVFVRSIVERTRVDHGVRLASDEHGDPAPLPVDLAHFIPPTDF